MIKCLLKSFVQVIYIITLSMNQSKHGKAYTKPISFSSLFNLPYSKDIHYISQARHIAHSTTQCGKHSWFYKLFQYIKQAWSFPCGCATRNKPNIVSPFLYIYIICLVELFTVAQNKPTSIVYTYIPNMVSPFLEIPCLVNIKLTTKWYVLPFIIRTTGQQLIFNIHVERSQKCT